MLRGRHRQERAEGAEPSGRHCSVVEQLRNARARAAGGCRDERRGADMERLRERMGAPGALGVGSLNLDGLDRALGHTGLALRALILIDLRLVVLHRDGLDGAGLDAGLAARALIPVYNDHFSVSFALGSTDFARPLARCALVLILRIWAADASSSVPRNEALVNRRAVLRGRRGGGRGRGQGGPGRRPGATRWRGRRALRQGLRGGPTPGGLRSLWRGFPPR